MTWRKIDLQELEQSIVAEASADLSGDRCDAGRFADVAVKSVFSYGAVHIDPKHLMVWVILDGANAEEVPPWYRVGDGPSLVPGPAIDHEIERWLLSLSTEIKRRFERAEWPTGRDVSVGFEVDSRVARGGGWAYFK